MHKYSKPCRICRNGCAYRRKRKTHTMVPICICIVIGILLVFLIPVWLLCAIIGAVIGIVISVFCIRRH